MKVKIFLELFVFIASGFVACIGAHHERDAVFFFGLTFMAIPILTFLCFQSRKKLYFSFFDADAEMPSFGGDGSTCTVCHEDFTKRNPHKGFGICEKCHLTEKYRLDERAYLAKHDKPGT
jgi:hypothetical protein